MNVLSALLTLVVVLASVLGPAPAWMRLGSAAAQAAPRVAYIYSTDTASRDAFASFLQTRGYIVDLVALANVATFDFTPDLVIIVGDDTGSLSTWGTSAAVDHITRANRPVVGVGEGGYAFFGRLSLAIGWGNGWHAGPQTGAIVVDAANPIWSTPNVVPATTGGTVGLYSTGSPFVAIFNPTAIAGVTRIGRQTDDTQHYPLISQGGCYFLWGFSNSPATMTQAGRDLFVNALQAPGCGAGSITISGIATCGVESPLLGGALVELFSGTSLVASTTADRITAAYSFRVAPGDYTVRITLGGTTCGGTANTDGTTTASPPLDLHNHSWPAAFRVNSLAPAGVPVAVDEHIFRQDQSAWFKFTVQPGSKVIVTLTQLPENYDLTLYKDVAAAYKTLTSPSDLVRLGAEFAPDAFSPDAFSPDAFSPDAFSPDAFSPDAFSPDAFSPDAFSPDAFSPDAFSPDAFSPDAFSPDAFSPDAFSPDAFSPDAFSPDAFSPDAFSGGETVSPSAFANAQTRSLIAVSAFNGTTSEGVLRNTWDNDTDFYVRVRGRNGAFSLASPFHLEITQLTGSCAPVAPITSGSTLGPAAGNFRTLVLTDFTRLPGIAAEITALKAQLATFVARSEVQGVVVDVSADGRVANAKAQADAHRDCPYAKNLLAAEIKRLVDGYRTVNTPLNQGGYLVLVGNDDVIPFFRHPDQAGLANEKGYVPPVLDASASQASLKLGYILGQDRYGTRLDLSRSDHTFPLPDLATGRVIETAADATALLAAYQSTPGGVVPTPKSALVTGYDFFADAATAIQGQFVAGLGSGGSVDALIEPGNLPPTDPSAWTAGDLSAQFLAKRHDLVFLGGHFSAVSALAADYTTRLLSTDVLASTVDLTNAIIFSEGCHSGYNVVDTDAIPNVTLVPDYPQALARKKATVIAGSGYQYGDTDTIEYGERLYLEFSKQLRTGTGAVSVGKALVAAKRAYLAATPRLTGIHEKSLLQSTLYGLPMLSVNMPGARLAPPSDGSIVGSTASYATNPGLTLGLRRADVTVNPALTTNTVPLIDTSTGSPVAPAASYLSGSGGVVTNPAEPILPLEVRNVSVSGTVLRGVGFRGGTYTDSTNIRPLTGATATELRTPHAPFASGVFYPVRPWSVNYFDALSGGATRLMLTPSQFISTTPELGIRRAFGPMSFRLFYSNNITTYGTTSTYPGNTPGLSAAPAISRVSGVPLADGNSVFFSIDVGGDPAAGVQEVWVTYTATSGPFAGQWQSLDLARGTPSTRWVGSLPLPTGQAADTVRFMVQAVNGVGLVNLATNLGAYYIPGPDTVPPTAPKQATAMSLLSPRDGPYREQVVLRAALSSNGAPLGGRTVIFGIGAQRRLAVTDASGNATTTLALLQTPGDYQASVAFQETPDLLGSSATSPFTITKRGTSLTLSPACGPLQATLRDSSGAQRTLRDQTVMFVVTGGSPYATATITDFLGRAPLNGLPLPDGNYNVAASFGSVVNLGGQALDLTDERYSGSTVNAALTLGDRSTSLTYTGETVIAAGSTLDLATSISSTRSLSGAIVCYTVRNTAGAMVALASAPVVNNTSTTTVTGLDPGVYSVESVLVGGTSATGFFTSALTVSLAVFDPSGGYVTGGGWIISPPGALLSDPTQTGRANFAFVSKYLPGTKVPTGQTGFEFKDGNLSFKSNSYEWLVVSGARAQYKGAGTINGAGNYGFMLTAIDGQVSGGGGVDKFRMKIWELATGKIVYDNQLGAADTANPTTTIAGGSIVIHK